MTSTPQPDSSGSGNAGQFVDLFLEHQRSIYRFILSLVGRSHDADDLLQEVSRTLWEKFDTFQPGTNFYAWATQIAHNKVLDYRRKQKRAPQLLDEDVLDVVASHAARVEPRWSFVHEALHFCLSRLKLADRKLIESRYEPDYDRERMAEQLGRTPNSVSNSLTRIRAALLACIRRRIAVDQRTDSADAV